MSVSSAHSLYALLTGASQVLQVPNTDNFVFVAGVKALIAKIDRQRLVILDNSLRDPYAHALLTDKIIALGFKSHNYTAPSLSAILSDLTKIAKHLIKLQHASQSHLTGCKDIDRLICQLLLASKRFTFSSRKSEILRNICYCYKPLGNYNMWNNPRLTQQLQENRAFFLEVIADALNRCEPNCELPLTFDEWELLYPRLSCCSDQAFERLISADKSIGKCKNLAKLVCMRENSLQAVPCPEKLTHLVLKRNASTQDIDKLKACVNLQSLQIKSSSLAGAIPHPEKLTSLVVADMAPLQSRGFIVHCTALETLILGSPDPKERELGNLDLLPSPEKLKYLKVNCFTASPDVLNKFSALTALTIDAQENSFLTDGAMYNLCSHLPNLKTMRIERYDKLQFNTWLSNPPTMPSLTTLSLPKGLNNISNAAPSFKVKFPSLKLIILPAWRRKNEGEEQLLGAHGIELTRIRFT